MMVTLGIYVRRWQRILRRITQDPRFHAIFQTIGYLAGGFFLSAASLGNCPQPFALGLLMSAGGWPAVLMAAGGMAGYLAFWGNFGTVGILWLGAGLIAAEILGGRPFLQRYRLLMPAISGAITAIFGAIAGIWLNNSVPVLIFFLQIILSICSTLLFQTAATRRDSATDWLLTGIGVLALAQVVPIPYLGFGYIAAGFFTLSGAFPAAALSGLALDLAQVTPVPMTGVLCLAYVARLIPGFPKSGCFGCREPVSAWL